LWFFRHRPFDLRKKISSTHPHAEAVDFKAWLIFQGSPLRIIVQKRPNNVKKDLGDPVNMGESPYKRLPGMKNALFTQNQG
jgi:hypothetical protein